ncbi:hypothetical protein [Desulfuromonas sp. TF]|uniref:hypothetical protein n=1 Tax=Desulfuromonas sp. TF TaxID=1232410 RepID=UPI0003FD8B18|nr:hypothetical protein [Desulfuromonas sp. TF]
MPDIENMLKDAGVAPGLMTNLIIELVELAKGDELPNDEKWQARIKKAIAPLDIEDRVRGQLYTAARKELDTAAMIHYRRTKEFKDVTNEDINNLFQQKWDTYVAKKAEKEAKKKAIAKAD